MTLILSSANYSQLRQQSAQTQSHHLALDDFEKLIPMPQSLGQGYTREMELSPGVWLDIMDFEFHNNLGIKVPVHDHLVQSLVLSSGLIGHDDDVYPTLGGSCSYLSGSGISPSYVARYKRSQRLVGVNIHLEPQVLETFFPPSQQGSESRQQLIKENEWKTSFFPEINLAMLRVIQQIINVPYQGITRRIYLQGKVFELLALQLDSILADQGDPLFSPRLKPDTITCLHQAREILTTQLENPPSSLELAQQVGVSDRTLQRGFKELFGTTVIGYLMQQRLKRAEQLLREGDLTVTEVANEVGYSHLGHFAAAFKQRFGMTPSQCLAGKWGHG